MGSNCWDDWKHLFTSKGYSCTVPDWPYKDGCPEELRNRQPDAGIASNRLTGLTDYYARIAEGEDNPILIGHCMGGLIVQLLLQRGIGSCGVAIHSVPPRGIFTCKLSSLKAAWDASGLFTSVQQSYMISFRTWQYAIANGMSCDEQKAAYYKFAIPESKLMIRDTLTAAAHINFNISHAPLLIMSGSNDHFIPAAINYENYLKYRHPRSITEYKECRGRNHLSINQLTWGEDATFVMKWISRQKL